MLGLHAMVCESHDALQPHTHRSVRARGSDVDFQMARSRNNREGLQPIHHNGAVRLPVTQRWYGVVTGRKGGFPVPRAEVPLQRELVALREVLMIGFYERRRYCGAIDLRRLALGDIGRIFSVDQRRAGSKLVRGSPTMWSADRWSAEVKPRRRPIAFPSRVPGDQPGELA